jgi:hypothetical protein
LSTAPSGRFRTFAGICAGLVIGGSLIAAPAKFVTASLMLPIALYVGRAQFAWLAVGEGVVILGPIVALLRQPRSVLLLAMIPHRAVRDLASGVDVRAGRADCAGDGGRGGIAERVILGVYRGGLC